MEASILLWIQEHVRNPFLTPIMQTVSRLGDLGLFWILLAAFLIILARIRAVRNKKTGRTGNPYIKPAIVTVLSMFLCFIIGHLILKPTIARVRPYDRIPELVVLTKKPKDFSFPSGHSSMSFAPATALFLTTPKKMRLVTIPLLLLALLIALSRLYLGVHYPTDVLAGSLLGIFCAWITATAQKSKKNNSDLY